MLKSTRTICLMVLSGAIISLCGCQNVAHWWQNGKRVGPNYCGPGAETGEFYTDADSPKIDSSSIPNQEWWHVFNDSELSRLVNLVYEQNLSLKSVTWRIAEARAQRNIAAGNLFPQSQAATSQYAHSQNSINPEAFFPGTPLTIDDWSVGFDATWEVDLWGRIRRAITSADANYQANIHDYDFLLVTLIGDVASLYVQIRSLDERIELARENVELQEGSLDIAKKRFQEGRTSKLDVVQADSNLAATQSLIPRLELAQRQAQNALAVLLGTPPNEIDTVLAGPGIIPNIPAQAIVGIPAELLRNRPDIRAAERRLAAQFEQIGIAHAELYPQLVINGTLGWQAGRFSDVFDSGSYTGSVAPGFRWKILNYGRLRNGIRVEEARMNQLCFEFKNTVLNAQREVEDAIVGFVKSSEQFEFDQRNADANKEAVDLATALFREGKENFNRVFVVQSGLVQAQDQLIDTKASIALALIETYKSLGGGWQIRCNPNRSMMYAEEFSADVLSDSQATTSFEDSETTNTDSAATADGAFGQGEDGQVDGQFSGRLDGETDESLSDGFTLPRIDSDQSDAFAQPALEAPTPLR